MSSYLKEDLRTEMEWCKVLVWVIITHTECQGTLMMTCNPQLQEVMQHLCHQNFLQSILWHHDPFKNSRWPVTTLRTQNTWDTVYNVNKNWIQWFFKSHNLIYFSQYNLQTHLMLKIRKHTILRKKYLFIMNLMVATRLRKVGTGATNGWKKVLLKSNSWRNIS